MYNKDILIDEIKNNKLPITKSEIEELSLSDSYVGKSDKDILQALVDLDLLLKKFFFRMMKKSKEKGLDFFKLCHKKMKKAYEVWSMACSNEYERNKLGTIYENSMFMHKEFYKQKTFASKEPLITVLMPTFNSENYIGETLWSVFEQTCPDFELLIMNEAGSSPETTEVISFFEDDRIKVVQNKTRLGLAESLNEGIKIARGKYIARIDADDLATEDRFELQANFLENNKEYGLCGSRQHHFGVDTDFVHEVAEEHDDIKAALIYGCEICHSTIMIRREYFLKNNLFYDNTKKAEDYELWTRAVHKFKFHNIKKVLGEYRVGAENITKNKFNALSAESAVIAANNLSKYLNVNVSKNHLEYLTGWENRFEEVEEKERKVALEEEEAILREMVKNNLIYKNYKDSSLLIAINRRWRWILGKYSYGHDLDEVLNVDDLFKKYPFSEIRCDEENCTDKSFSLKQCLKGVLKFFYTPFRHGISYKMRQQLWDLDGHLKDSKDEILNNVTDSKYDILNHVKDSETRLKQQTYLMLEKNGNELYGQLERSIEKLEGQVESIKAMVESQNASLKEMIDSRIYKAETNLGQTFDSRIYKAETNLGQTFDSRIYKAEENLSQTFDSRIYKAEENLSQTVDGRVWKSELYLKKEILGKIWILNRMLTDLVNLQKDKSEYGSTSIYGSNFYEDNQYGSYLSAIEVLKYVIPIYKPESIVDFGCGTGTWLAAARQINRDIQIIGVDGDYVDTDMLMIDKEYFLPRDLSKELDLHRKFDIAMSLEVAEHLEEKYADIFVDTLCRHSDIILFSAAHVGQGGDGHVNEQPISYWVEKFQKRGYTWHDIRDVFKANYDIEQWYKDNISIFIKER
ncbi:MAG: glycosyltransferase [Lachnospiraceae bacterium]|nr:MAG: glycosyltransferase [Lachnospiraceae bacterium]